MVKYRGIEIEVVSQFEASTLPEYRPKATVSPNAAPVLQSNSTSTVSVYIPAYSGSQFWLEYKIDGPHPPKAVYFFKMTYKNQVITSWDTTEKLGFQGKTMMALRYLGTDPYTGQPMVQRGAFHFSAPFTDVAGAFDDCIEISIYRVEHRQQIALGSNVSRNQLGQNVPGDNMRLQNGGLLEVGAPKRFYKYQLLDPVDDPHARFRFYFRSVDYLREHGIVDSNNTPSLSGSGSQSSLNYSDVTSNVSPRTSHESVRSEGNESATNLSSDRRSHVVAADVAHGDNGCGMFATLSDGSSSTLPPFTHESNDSQDLHEQLEQRILSPRKMIKARPSPLAVDNTKVRLSPRKGLMACLKTPMTPTFLRSNAVDRADLCNSPVQQEPLTNSVEQQEPLTISIDGVEFDLSKKDQRSTPTIEINSAKPMNFVTPTPPTAPPHVTTFTIEDEIAEMQALARVQGGGKPLEKTTHNDTTRDEREHAAQPLRGLLRRAKMRKEEKQKEKEGSGLDLKEATG